MRSLRPAIVRDFAASSAAGWGLLVVSVAAHLTALAWVRPRAIHIDEGHPRVIVEVEIPEPAAPETPVKEESIPEPAPKVVEAHRAKAPPQKLTAPQPQPVAPESARAPSPDLGGTTMTSDLAGAWSASPGNGGSAIGQGEGLRLPPAPAPPPPPAEPAVIPLADLMRRPVAPPLDAILEREYPRDARLQGLSGSALLRVQILPDGSVLVRRQLFESEHGFGEACQRALRGTHWTPALDREGRPARTEISYRCKFEIRT